MVMVFLRLPIHDEVNRDRIGFRSNWPSLLQYFTHGQGPEVVVFVHGHGASARIWRLTQEALGPHWFRTIAINNWGAGDSDHTPREENYSAKTFARALWAAMWP